MSDRAAAPAVDILINNHDYGEFLPDAIDSALGQTHPAVNVLVVDDGSTDGSRELLREREDEVTVILKEAGGQASALNEGLSSCEGEVVIFLDADDVLHPEAAARAAAAFAADESLTRVQFRMDVIDAEGRETGVIKPAEHLPMPQGDMRAAELAYPFDITWMAMSANAFRTEVVRRITPIPSADYPVSGADWYLVHLTALIGPIASLEEVLASYRVHGRNSYEPQSAELSLPHVRKAIERSAATSKALLRLADELDQPRPQQILSIADLANRIISVKLEPERHPIAGDSLGGLVRDAVGAARRRDNVAAPMRIMFVAWFVAIAVSPRRLARHLAILFLFPVRRSSLNRALARMQARD
jgi:glycosyltransferase involved in cell wall biosynthesis